jgi:hypothetical protein
VKVWAKHLSDAIAAPRFDGLEASRRINKSPFSVAESYRQLHSLYASVDNASA